MSFLDIRRLREFHAAYLSALGRAIAICQHFEDCGRHVSATWAITDDAVDGLGHNELRVIARRVGSAPLERALRKLRDSQDYDREDFSIVDQARDARNWFAHEAATCIHFPARDLMDDLVRMREFYARIDALCAGAAILAVGSYEITERERAPEPFASGYRQQLRAWVTEPLLEWIGWHADRDDPDELSTTSSPPHNPGTGG